MPPYLTRYSVCIHVNIGQESGTLKEFKKQVCYLLGCSASGSAGGAFHNNFLGIKPRKVSVSYLFVLE